MDRNLLDLISPCDRVIVAALVPAKGDEDCPVVEAVAQAVQERGAVVVGTLIQRRGVSHASRPGGARNLRRAINRATFFGKGKVAELAAAVRRCEATRVVFCNPLTPTQQRNLQEATGVPVVWYRPDGGAAVAVSEHRNAAGSDAADGRMTKGSADETQ